MANLGMTLAILGAVLSALLTGIGSAFSVGKVGEAANGLVSQDPSTFSKVLILELLPGTQGLYGLLVAVLLLSRLGIIGGAPAALTTVDGLMYFLACIPMAVGGLISALAQGKVAIAGVGLVAKKPDQSGKSVIMAAMVETYAILSLLISILLVYNI